MCVCVHFVQKPALLFFFPAALILYKQLCVCPFFSLSSCLVLPFHVPFACFSWTLQSTGWICLIQKALGSHTVHEPFRSFFFIDDQKTKS